MKFVIQRVSRASVTVDGEGLPVKIKVADCTVELRERSAL